MPGFVDTHLHAPQYSYTGTALDVPLLEWLNKYTFPQESRFSDTTHARDVYTKCVKRLLASGTTCAAYYATLHVEASKVLVDVMRKYGQRGWVGKVCMDWNSPSYYCESSEEAIEGTRELIQWARQGDDGGLVEPCVTPRFAPSCHMDTLKALGKLANDMDVAVQSHLSENVDEIKWVTEVLFPDVNKVEGEHEDMSATYTDVYAHAGLLTKRTVMAHCIHLSAYERALIRTRETGVSHCPTSNFGLRSGVLNVRQLLREGIKVGLGTDIGGGYATSMLEVIRAAAVASRIIQMGSEDHIFLSLTELFFLATLGGAQVMGLESKIGSFVVGKQFDALLVDVQASGTIDLFDGIDDWMGVVEKFVFLGDDRSIAHVWVNGKLVK
jgi:guanine deaminase